MRYYEVRLSMGSSNVVPWKRIERQTDVTLPGLTLAAGVYTFSVRALSLSGLMSDEASVAITVTDKTPVDSGTGGGGSYREGERDLALCITVVSTVKCSLL